MSGRFSALLAVAALLGTACGGGNGSADAGIDARIEADAGSDGAVGDGGPEDAGASDGGMGIAERTMARDEARAAEAMVTLTRDTIPADMRTGAEFLSLEVTRARIDAVIGEKGVIDMVGVIGEKGTTLSLPINAVPTLVIAQQLDAAVLDLQALLDRTGWAVTTDPMLRPLGDACVALHDRLDTLRALMWRRLREIVDSVDIGLFPEVTGYVDARTVDLSRSNDLHFVVEGHGTADPTATVQLDCGDFQGTVRIVDEESDTELLATVTQEPGTPLIQSVPLEAGVVRALRAEIGVVDSFGWISCAVSLSGTRHFRGTAEPIDSAEQATLASAEAEWVSRVGELDSAIIMATGGPIDALRLAAIERVFYEASAAASPFRELDTATQIYADDYEIHALRVRIVAALAAALQADALIATDPALMAAIDGLEAALQSMVTDSAPGHVGGAA